MSTRISITTNSNDTWQGERLPHAFVVAISTKAIVWHWSRLSYQTENQCDKAFSKSLINIYKYKTNVYIMPELKQQFNFD